jgi:outer membrane receptor protein involved in Fe transport
MNKMSADDGSRVRLDAAQGARRLSLAIASICVAASAQAQTESGNLQEIIVTATRRESAVQDIPYNISVVSGTTLENANISDISAMVRLMPGVTYIDSGIRGNAVNNQIIIRGMNSSDVGRGASVAFANSPTVSTYIDDTPVFFNVKLTDINRVEVLRGPQGTLYGAGSVGGTVRFIFNEPDPTHYSGSATAKLSRTSGSSGLNESLDVVLNLPLADQLALRLSAGLEHEAGVFDDAALVVTDSKGTPILADPADPLTSPWVTHTVHDTDAGHMGYVRAALLWKPADIVKVLLTYQHQEDQASGFPYQTLHTLSGAEPLQMTRPLLEPLTRTVNLTALDVTADLGFATLTSDSSYFDNDSHSVVDFSAGLQNIDNQSQLYGGFPRIYSPINTTNTENSFVQELRLVSKLSGNWEWIAGLYFQSSRTTYQQLETFPGYGAWSLLPGNPLAEQFLGKPGASWADYLLSTGVTLPNLLSDVNYTLDRRAHFEDRAAFGELTYHFSPAWRLTVGTRVFSQFFDQSLVQTLPGCGPFCSDDGVNPLGITSAAASQTYRHHIFKANLAYEPVHGTLIYANWAEGFRRGGANALPLAGPFGVPANLIQYQPDTATNYEIGIKGQTASRVSYTADVYRINWNTIQIPSFTSAGGFDFVFNGGNARSQGVEVEVQAALTPKLGITAGYSYTDAYLTSPYSVQGTEAQSGDRLPGVPRNQASLAVDYAEPLGGDASIRFHIDGSYRSGVTTAVNATNPNFAELPGFTIVNLTIAFERPTWKVGAFVDNLTDSPGVTGVDITLPIRYQKVEFASRPRTTGLFFDVRFDRAR